MSRAEPLPARLPLFGEGAAGRGGVLGAALIAAGVVALRTLGRGPGPAVAGACFALGIVLLIVAFFRWHGMRQARALADAMQAGDYIASWIVPPDVWREHLAREHAGQSNVVRIATFAGLGIGVTFAALVVGTSWAEGHDVSTWLVPTVGAVAVTTLVFGLVGAGMRVLQGRRLRRLAGSEAVICIADRGLYHAGELWRHDGSMPVFLGVELIAGAPRLLAFTYRFSSPKGSYTEVVRVPMPPTDAVIRPDVILSRLSRR